jgi:hypothetical protein
MDFISITIVEALQHHIEYLTNNSITGDCKAQLFSRWDFICFGDTQGILMVL